jgi:hypothetical protein
MKLKFFFFGFILGGLIFYVSSYIINKTKETNVVKNNAPLKTDTAKWNWPDSLDALVAAPVNHKLVFENEEFRILEVTVNPGQLDPIHTHKGESIVWGVMTSPIVYNTFGLDSNNKLTLVKKDTIIVKPEELNKGIREYPEPPHSVQNIGKDTFRLYRIEYKRQ